MQLRQFMGKEYIDRDQSFQKIIYNKKYLKNFLDKIAYIKFSIFYF